MLAETVVRVLHLLFLDRLLFTLEAAAVLARALLVWAGQAEAVLVQSEALPLHLAPLIQAVVVVALETVVMAGELHLAQAAQAL